MRPDAELVYWNLSEASKEASKMATDETERSHLTALLFMKRFGGSFLYVPKIDEYERTRRNELVRKLVIEEGQHPYLVAPHFGLSAQMVRDICDGKDVPLPECMQHGFDL